MADGLPTLGVRREPVRGVRLSLTAARLPATFFFLGCSLARSLCVSPFLSRSLGRGGGACVGLRPAAAGAAVGPHGAHGPVLPEARVGGRRGAPSPRPLPARASRRAPWLRQRARDVAMTVWVTCPEETCDYLHLFLQVPARQAQ